MLNRIMLTALMKGIPNTLFYIIAMQGILLTLNVQSRYNF
jgi:hypothetical protein